MTLEQRTIWLFGFMILALSIAGAAYPPYSMAIVLAGIFGIFLLIARPDLAFGFFFAIETLFSEDVLLVTEMLKQTIFRVPLPYVGVNVFEAALVVLVMITLIQRRGKLYGTALDPSVLLFGLACLIGYITCLRLYGDPGRLFEPRRLLHFFVAYYLTVNLIRSKASLKAFLTLFFIAVIMKSLQGMYIYLSGQGFEIKWHIRAIFTGWEDSLTFVTFLLFVGVMVLEPSRFPLKKLYIVMAPVVLFTFIFSYKRAYYVAIFVGTLVLFWLQGRQARMRMLIILCIAGILAMGFITYMGQWEAIGMRFESILNPTKESSANYRLVEWKNAMISIYKNPIFGIGLGGVMPMEIFLSRTNLLGVHNTYLWVAVKLGVIGLFPFLLLHLCFLRRLYFLNYALKDDYLRSVSRGLFCSFIAFATAEMFAPMFAQMRTATWFGIILGLGMMLSHMERSARKED